MTLSRCRLNSRISTIIQFTLSSGLVTAYVQLTFPIHDTHNTSAVRVLSPQCFQYGKLPLFLHFCHSFNSNSTSSFPTPSFTSHSDSYLHNVRDPRVSICPPEMTLNTDNQQYTSALSSRCLIPANAKNPERQGWKNTPRVSHRGSALYAQNLILPQAPGILTQRNQWISLYVLFRFSPRYVRADILTRFAVPAFAARAPRIGAHWPNFVSCYLGKQNKNYFSTFHRRLILALLHYSNILSTFYFTHLYSIARSK